MKRPWCWPRVDSRPRGAATPCVFSEEGTPDSGRGFLVPRREPLEEICRPGRRRRKERALPVGQRLLPLLSRRLKLVYLGIDGGEHTRGRTPDVAARPAAAIADAEKGGDLP